MNQQQISKHDDPKTWVTPFAFDVAPNILYLPLASPLKRGLAMLIDGLLVAVLADSAGWIFVLLVLGTLFIQKQSKKVGKLLKWGLYILMLLALISALASYFYESKVEPPRLGNSIANNEVVLQPEEIDVNLENLAGLLNYGPAIIAVSQCSDYSCAEKSLIKLQQAFAKSSLSAAKQTQIIDGLVAELPLTATQKQLLSQQQATGKPVLRPTELKTSADINAEITPLSEAAENITASGDTFEQDFMSEMGLEERLETLAETSQALEKQTVQLGDEPTEDDTSSTSPLAWFNGLLNDLGLGFGWAAFYFTVFTAWFDGQTLGKKLFGIRVIQLDGTKISLWDAFGRYGGYAAGFTTGLLGFFQIYWDANRQAIQDKISATVVIDVRKTKHEAAQEHSPIDNSSVNLSVQDGANI